MDLQRKTLGVKQLFLPRLSILNRNNFVCALDCAHTVSDYEDGFAFD